MPPKPIIKVHTTPQKKKRTDFARRRILSSVIVTAPQPFNPHLDGGKYDLFLSFRDIPAPNAVRKKKPIKKTIPSPDVSDVQLSSDEEGAGQYELPDADDDEEEKIRKMNAEFDSIDNTSIEVFNGEGIRVKLENGKLIPHEKQPPPAWRPGVREEYIGNYPMMNKKAKKKCAVKKKNPVQKVAHERVPPRSGYESLCISIQVSNARQIAKADFEKKVAQQSFRVFGTPPRIKNLDPRKDLDQENQPDDRLSMFNYTPIRGNRIGQRDKTDSNMTDLIFSPKVQNASTPIERQVQSRKTKTYPVFDFSPETITESRTMDRQEAANSRTQVPEGSITTASTCVEEHPTRKATVTYNERSVHASVEDELDSVFLHLTEHGKVDIPERLSVENELESSLTSTSYRKAETSVTDLLFEAEAEKSFVPNQEDSKYSKKRQRTKSPDTMCQGVSTVVTMQNEQEEFELETEKENAFKKRGTLQPQQRQLDRESRMSRLSVISTTSSCHESINSAMEEMSLDTQLLDEETMGEDLGRTQFSESRAESRNIPTGMTIHNEDPSMLPFYLADLTSDMDLSPMAQLLHVVEQKETKKWENLPKKAFDGRRVKKLGEGAYGEVFSTIWDNNKPVAIKVVPFEADKLNRLYKGEYHSDEMQSADVVLPEVVVMKELSELKNINSPNSTPNFINIISAEIVTGNYPKGLLKAWDNYTLTKDSVNTRPDKYSSENQNFIVFVAANGGVALEDFVLKSENEMRSILNQLIMSMQAAELELEFEHRDLHLGNVLIDRNGVEELDYRINNHKVPLKTHGVKVNIIDFTLSRISKGHTTVFSDLENDPDLFTGDGDPQFEVYRKMRTNCRGKWRNFEKKTNLMWIEYIANRLLDTKICPEGLITDKRKEELRKLFKRLGEYESCGSSFIDTEFYNDFYNGYFGEVAKPQSGVSTDDPK